MQVDFKIAKNAHLQLGKRGENIAVRFLRNRNFEILARNYRCPYGEIDIVARDGATLCFIEVKTRRTASKSRPVEGLSQKQKDRIRKASKRYLSEIHMENAIFRFDLIEVVLSPWDCKEFRHWTKNF